MVTANLFCAACLPHSPLLYNHVRFCPIAEPVFDSNHADHIPANAFVTFSPQASVFLSGVLLLVPCAAHEVCSELLMFRHIRRQGLETVRACREQAAFQLRCQQLIDASSRIWWTIQAST